MNINKTDILALNQEQLYQSLSKLGWEKYRLKQIEEWLWKHGVRQFEEMSNLSKNQRELLDLHFFIPSVLVEKMQTSNDGTLKFKFKLHDGYFIESVLIPVSDENRFTVCVSSQAGCSLSCAFCATGQMGLLRQLTASEIFDQYFIVNQKCLELYSKPVTNVVYMGMGEPLLNYKNVLHSIERLTSGKGPNLAPKRITISTAGIAKMIKKLADDQSKVNLALSLHAADDKKRNQIMAINETNNLASLMEALKYYYQKTKNRVSFEYIAFHEINDHSSDAKNLVRLCSQFPVMVNVIEYNPVRGLDFEKSSTDRINQFAKEVLKHGIMITVRRSRGKDIDAACGQLANLEV
ncbi:MAG: 23S rRNA (adenine(2503)-C(2))-methyltransferase RlmN [Saprospiraceae bacterium]|nr:23S rRNA (adenine(2503)-C(2))-methyltransferase RlmN [Saprospiraceae bacterium]MBK8485316.1 23S rRNA (adenine(2503)-C(2))-methyltransferase RlmN [Saprospiraceae bacterium]MBK9222536.1 23S rRNA (adenine(2503)-C(2))-methyltransferase RlmN [Saprospiraceae bacterium]